MIENRLELNKKPVYELPEEVIIEQYIYSKDRKRYAEPNFVPDICLNAWGTGMTVRKPKETVLQMWVKTDNKDLIRFISEYDWIKVCPSCCNAPNLNMWQFKKVISEEFYGIKEGNQNK